MDCEVVTPKSADRRPVDDPSATPRKGRSKVTNGKVLIAGVDQRSPWVRRCKDIVAAHLSDLGGEDNASTAARSIIRRATGGAARVGRDRHQRLRERQAARNDRGGRARSARA